MQKTHSLWITAVTTSLVALLPASVHSKESQSIDVPPQALADALVELSEETGINVFASQRVTEGVVTRGAKGPLTTEQALDNLLVGTRLRFEPVDDGFAIVSQNANDAEFLDLGTIVLTGERVERDVFSTTSSVRAYDGEELEENVQNSDLERVIEGAANVTTLGVSNNTPVIRGQLSGGPVGGAGAALSGQLPRATLTIDGRPGTFEELAYSPTSIWDVDTVEVFRGPQTTSQGANSIAGAFNIRTRDPIFEQEFAARAEVASRGGHVLSFMANTPLSDSVAIRFAIDQQSQDGFINFPAGNLNPDAESRAQLTARFKVLWEPVDIPELSTKLTVTFTDFVTPQTQNVVEPFNLFISNAGPSPFPSAFVGDSLSFTHDIDYDLGGGFKIRNQLTYSMFESSRTTGDPTQTDLTVEGETLVNELTLAYDPENGPLSGIFGIYVNQSEASTPSGIIFNDEKFGYGVYTEATYRFSNGFDATASVRYQENSQDRFVNAAFPPVNLNFSGTFDAWLPKFGIGYEPYEDLRVSFQASRGFNPGGIGGSFLGILGILPIANPFFEFEDETVWNYELAMRGRFLDGRLFIASNAFFSDFNDYQFSVPTLLTGGFVDSIISNAERVETYGLEIEADYLATDRLRLNAALGFLRTEVKRFSAAAVPIVGNQLPFAPEVTAALGFDYDYTDRFTLGGQIRYTDGYYSDIANSPSGRVSAYTLLDLRASYQMTDTALAYLYVNNVFDTITPVSLFPGPVPRTGVTTAPREIGFGVRANW
ncbi:MAG: TonB-dependent receptor [Pseudomonadota bacterium]